MPQQKNEPPTRPAAPVIGRIAPGPHGTTIVISETNGLTIEIQGLLKPMPADTAER